MLSKCTAVVVLLSFYIKFAASIHCYQCNSQNNSMCLDPTLYDQETLTKYLPTVQCGEGIFSAAHHGFFCRKIVQSVLHKGYEADVRVTRSCGWIKHHRDCYKADNEDHLETVCQCFSDVCNTGSSVILTFGAIATTLSVIGLKYIL